MTLRILFSLPDRGWIHRRASEAQRERCVEFATGRLRDAVAAGEECGIDDLRRIVLVEQIAATNGQRPAVIRIDQRDARRVRRMCRLEGVRSEEHTSELQSLMHISYAVFCLKKKKR